MHFNFQKHQSKQLVQDFISWRLTIAGFTQWNLINKIDLVKNSKIKYCSVMRQLAFEFGNKYERKFVSFNFQFEPNEKNFRDIFNAILIDLFDLTDNYNDYESKESDSESDNRLSETCINLNFGLISKENHNLKCSWGKIIGLFAFIGSLAIKCYIMNESNLIYYLIDLLTDFLNNDKRIFTWINLQGSWNGFVDYFNERHTYFNIAKNDTLPIEISSESSEESIKNFTNFTNNSSISRSPSTINLLSRSISDSVLSQNEHQSYLTMLQTNFKSKFFRLGQYTAVAVGSVGVLLLGAVYMNKKSI